MTYTPTQWKDGDLVTSAKLNKLEQGVAAGGGAFFVHCTATYDEEEGEDIGPLDKTWNEISEAAESGPVILVINGDEQSKSFEYLHGLYSFNNEYHCRFSDGLATIDFSSPSLDGELSMHHIENNGQR